MDNAPKIAVLVVIALVVGVIFVGSSKTYSNDVSSKTTQQTTTLFGEIGK